MNLTHRDLRYLTVATLLSAVLLWPAAGSAQQSFTHRLTSIVYDYDNNGTTDATTLFEYDTSGRATSTSYAYAGDGTPDLFVTEDDDAASEAGVVGYDADDLLTSFALVRQLMGGGTEEFDSTFTFVNGALTRVDSAFMLGGVPNAGFTTVSYLDGRIDRIEDRMTSNGALVSEQFYAYGPDDLPNLVTFESSGIDAVTTLAFRGDGQLDDLSTTVTFGAAQIGAGGADYAYDADGVIQSEAWAMTGTVGSPFAEFQGVSYRKTYTYDAANLKALEQIDIGDDGSVEATRTFVWQPGACVPAFIFAQNGRPNFARFDGLSYVPGTGATYLENCGPVGCSDPSDLDCDGIANVLDLCPFFSSPNQTDSDMNGIGNVCECGDQNGDGFVNVADILDINAAIFELQPAGPLCDTNDDGLCNIADVLGVNARIFGTPAHCARYPAP